MSDQQLIQDWQEKVRKSYGDESKMFEYLFQTMDNFYYRYLETTSDRDLKTKSFGPHLWGARSEETSMVDALKLTNPVAKRGIIDLAKTVPKTMGPKVKYELTCDVQELTIEHGKIVLAALINWGHPDYNDPNKMQKKSLTFTYSDLGQFRKELAQKLEEVSEIFL